MTQIEQINGGREMTLNQLIQKTSRVSNQLSSGDVPIVLDGNVIYDMTFSIKFDKEGGYFVQIDTQPDFVIEEN